jgi:hypothetical protein
MIIRYANSKVNLNPRKRFSASNASTTVENRAIILRNLCIDPKLSYAWYVIDISSGQAIFKSDYSNRSTISYMPETTNDLLIRAYVKASNGQRKSAIVSALTYNGNLGCYEKTEKYPYMNLAYRGHSYEEINNNTFVFRIDMDYSLPYSVKWYIYKNGGIYYVNTTANIDEFKFSFDQPGNYTVMYYITTPNGENLFYNYDQIAIL